jgi:hypothetical protein
MTLMDVARKIPLCLQRLPQERTVRALLIHVRPLPLTSHKRNITMSVISPCLHSRCASDTADISPSEWLLFARYAYAGKCCEHRLPRLRYSAGKPPISHLPTARLCLAPPKLQPFRVVVVRLPLPVLAYSPVTKIVPSHYIGMTGIRISRITFSTVSMSFPKWVTRVWRAFLRGLASVRGTVRVKNANGHQ